MVRRIDEDPLRTIINNVERLLSDARLLLDRGSPGLAMATAILAFEETGKGQSYEIDIPKTKRGGSWHHFRQVVASFVLAASFNQKCGIPPASLPAELEEQIRSRWENAGSFADAAAKPIPDSMRQALREAHLPYVQDNSDDEMMILGVEARWIKKLLVAAGSGRVEQARQRGIYVDVEAEAVTSSPSSVTPHEAEYWLDVANRAYRILRFGDYLAPYGPLSTFLSGLPRPLPPLPELYEQFRQASGCPQ